MVDKLEAWYCNSAARNAGNHASASNCAHWRWAKQWMLSRRHSAARREPPRTSLRSSSGTMYQRDRTSALRKDSGLGRNTFAAARSLPVRQRVFRDTVVFQVFYKLLMTIGV